jgi:Fe-S cluster biogenesis protein NfuA
VSGLKRVRLREFFLLIVAYGMAGRKKIVRLKEGSACEECPLRENTLYFHYSKSLMLTVPGVVEVHVINLTTNKTR